MFKSAVLLLVFVLAAFVAMGLLVANALVLAPMILGLFSMVGILSILLIRFAFTTKTKVQKNRNFSLPQGNVNYI